MEAYITTISKQRQWDFIARFGPRQLGKTGTVVELTSKEMPVERVNSKKRVVEDEVEDAEEGEKVICPPKRQKALFRSGCARRYIEHAQFLLRCVRRLWRPGELICEAGEIDSY